MSRSDVQVEIDQALPAIGKLGGSLQDIVDVQSYSADGQRTAIVVQKVEATRDIYPRKEGRPQKRPL